MKKILVLVALVALAGCEPPSASVSLPNATTRAACLDQASKLQPGTTITCPDGSQIVVPGGKPGSISIQ